MCAETQKARFDLRVAEKDDERKKVDVDENLVSASTSSRCLSSMRDVIALCAHAALLCETTSSTFIAACRSTKQDRWFLLDGLLMTLDHTRPFAKLQLVIPESMQIPLTIYIHSHKWFTHFGVSRTVARMRENYFFSNMRQVVSQVVRACTFCQRHKRTPRAYHGIRRTLSKVGPWDTLGIDIFGPLPTASSGFKYIVVVIDQFSKWVELFPCRIVKSEKIADILMSVFHRFGCPRRILTDRGPQFNSKMIRELCLRLGTQKVFTSAYRPQADGIAEAFMKVLGKQLAILTDGRPKSWNKYLSQIEFAYRTTPHPSTGETPFYMMYGYDAKMPDFSAIDVWDKEDILEPLQKEAKDRLTILRDSRRYALERLFLLYQQQLAKEPEAGEYNQVKYRTSELILVKVSPYDLQQAMSNKLTHKWKAPYRVSKVLSNELSYEVVCLETGGTQTVHIGNTRPFYALDIQNLVHLPIEKSQLIRRAPELAAQELSESEDSE